MRSFVLARKAQGDLTAIWRAKAGDRPRVAAELILRLLAACQRLTEHPYTGRSWPEIEHSDAKTRHRDRGKA